MLRNLVLVISLILSLTSSYKMKMQTSETNRIRNKQRIKARQTTRILSFAYDDDDGMDLTMDVDVSSATKAL